MADSSAPVHPPPLSERPRLTDAEGQPLVPVDGEELRRAILVWLKTMPSHLWRPYEAMLAIEPRRRTDEDRADPRAILAAYLVAKFEQANWRASYPEPLLPSGRPSKRHCP